MAPPRPTPCRPVRGRARRRPGCVARLLSLVERGGDDARAVGRLAYARSGEALHGRHHRRAGRRQVHADERPDRPPARRRRSRSRCWPSTRRRRSPAAPSSATGCACRTTPPTPACSSGRWRPAATSAGSSLADARGGAPARRDRPALDPRRDGRRRPGRGRDRRQGRHDGRRRQPRLGRQRAGQQGRAAGDRRRVRDQQGRPQGCRRDPPRPRADARPVRARRTTAGGRRSWPRWRTTGEGVTELWDAVARPPRTTPRRAGSSRRAGAFRLARGAARDRRPTGSSSAPARSAPATAGTRCTDAVAAARSDPWTAADEMLARDA